MTYQNQNPAYCGTQGPLTVNLAYRNQWVGFEGAPVSQLLTVQTSLFKNKIGLGCTLLNDKVGPLKQVLPAIDVAYKIQTSTSSYLSFGLKTGGQFVNLNISNLKLMDANDPMFAEDVKPQNQLFIGSGLYFQSKKIQLGVSAPRLWVQDRSNYYSAKQHVYGLASIKFNLHEHWIWKPSTLIKVPVDAPIQYYIQNTFIYNKKIAAGILYRSGDAIGANIGLFIGKKLLFSYAFDWSFNNTTTVYNSGTHELLFRFSLKDKSDLNSIPW
jgi:type IX secretion system PorP/SprF family membrane protein